MKGYSIRWIPGVDHAGIATQSVVEKQMYKKEKLTRKDVSRSDFMERVWKWKQVYGSKIIHQLEKLGGALDWDHSYFTMYLQY